MLEKDLEARVVRYAKSRQCLCYKFSSPAHRGVPDRLVIAPGGRVGFLELKRPGEQPTALQLSTLNQIRLKGATADWADSFEAAKLFIDALILT